MSIHVVLTGVIYHGYERRLCLQRWKTAWLNFYLPLWKGSCATAGRGLLPAPVMHLSMGLGEGREVVPKGLCPSVVHRKKPWQGRGEGVCEPASWGLPDGRVVLGMWRWDGSCPPGETANWCWGSHLPPLAALEVPKSVEQCSQAGQRGDLTSWDGQQRMEETQSAVLGCRTQREVLLASLEIVWKKQKRLWREKKTYENIPQQYSAEIFFCLRVCHGERCWFCTSSWQAGAQAGWDPVHRLFFAILLCRLTIPWKNKFLLRTVIYLN